MASYGYCPNCKKNVTTKREQFRYLLAFLLAFTGIGLIIYILYYIDRKPNHCIHCNSVCQAPKSDIRQIQKVEHKEETEYQVLKQNHEAQLKFCPNCGVEVGERGEIKYCALCGSSIA